MTQDTAYLVLGLTLVVALVAITAWLYQGKRRESGERAKYTMLDDE